MALHVLAYNLTRVINNMGPGRLIAAIRTQAVRLRLSPDAMRLPLAVRHYSRVPAPCAAWFLHGQDSFLTLVMSVTKRSLPRIEAPQNKESSECEKAHI
jgi:hypothetical protein